ncbi:MAG: 50S ribosomal protein L22 [Candidatus Gracilibacteria bacterium]
MKAIRRYLRISSKKVNLVAGLVRGKPVQEAIEFLQFTPKKSAGPLMETIKSALANAEQNFKQNKKDLYVSKIIINEGATQKRSRPVSRGRSHPILKRTSHIKVELSVLAGKEDSKKKKVVEKHTVEPVKAVEAPKAKATTKAKEPKTSKK